MTTNNFDESKLLKPSDMTEHHLINSVRHNGLSHSRKAECLFELIDKYSEQYIVSPAGQVYKEHRFVIWMDYAVQFFSYMEILPENKIKLLTNLSKANEDLVHSFFLSNLKENLSPKDFCTFIDEKFYPYIENLSKNFSLSTRKEVYIPQLNEVPFEYKQYNDNHRKFNCTLLDNDEKKMTSLVAKLQAAGFKCIAKDESIKQFIYLDIDTKSYRTTSNRSEYASSNRRSFTEAQLNDMLDDMIQKSNKEHTMSAAMQTHKDVTVSELDSLIMKGFPVAFHCYTPGILEIINNYDHDEDFKHILSQATKAESEHNQTVYITISNGKWNSYYSTHPNLLYPDKFVILNVLESKSKSKTASANHKATVTPKLTREQARSMDISTQNNTPIINKGPTMKQVALEVLSTNKQTFTTAAQITAGKTINKQVMKKLAPKLPFMLQGYAKHPVASIVLSNVVAFGIKQYLPNNKKANLVADMMMQAAAVETMDSFNFEGMIDELLSSVTLPAGALEENE